MSKKIIFLFLIFITESIYSQNKYPNDVFQNPLDIPLVLSGTFGELRSNHFHAGIDIKTQQREGLNVFASGDGYVSRIKISHWGYGKALYITHSNGYTTVYGHLKKFSPKIEDYVRKRQYEKESFEIQLYPKPSELKILKGEIIALSGNSGSSGGPHLHFEIRDTRANPINPMLFGINIPDHKRPIFKNTVVYAKNDTSQVNKSNNYIDLVVKQQNNGDYIANKIYAYGTIGIGINAIDKLDGAINNNGLYDLQMEVNGEKKFQYTVEKFSFSESRYLNNFIDYERFINKKQRIQKCFIDPNTKLSIYKNIIDKGLISIKDSLEYRIQITASDFTGNQTKLIIPVQGKKDTILHFKKINKTPYFFKANQSNSIRDSIVTAYFPENIFYEDFYFDYQYKNGVAKLHNPSVAVHKNFVLSFDVSKYTKDEIKHLYIVRKNKSGRLYYSPTRYKNNKLYTNTKILCHYTLAKDYDKPKIFHHNFKSNQSLTKKRYLMVRISDKGSGIKSYRAEIDGKWVLMEYKPKKNTLTYDFNDKKLTGNEHILKIIVTDNVNNSTTFTSSFNRKE